MNTKLNRMIIGLLVLTSVLATCAPQTVAPTATATATVAPTATVEPTITSTPGMKFDFAINLEKSQANTMGQGAFHLVWEMIESFDGTYNTPEEARDAWQSDPFVDKVLDACDYESLYSEFESFTISNYGQMSEYCGELYTELTGREPIETLSHHAIEMLYQKRGSAGGDFPRLLVIGRDSGRIYGQAHDEVNINELCGIASLEYVGWDGSEEVFIADWNKDEVWDILWDSMAVGDNAWGPSIPDFCGDQKMVATTKPNWIGTSQGNDMLSFRPNKDIMIELHTDPTRCDQHEWSGGILAIVKGVWTWNNEAFEYKYLIQEHDLIAFEFHPGTDLKTERVYMTIIDGKLVWYKQAADGYIQSAIELGDWSDGYSPWLMVAREERWEVSPYIFEGTPYSQFNPIEIEHTEIK